MQYQFIGQSHRIYPDLMDGAKVLEADPGDRREFDKPPADGLWVPVSYPVPAAKTAKPAKES